MPSGLLVFVSWFFSCNEMVVDIDIGMGGIKDKGCLIPGHTGSLGYDDMELPVVYGYPGDLVATDIVDFDNFHREPLFIGLSKAQVLRADTDFDF